MRKKRIVNFCRLEPQKNLKLLLDSMILVHDRFPEYSLDIYGDGVQRKELEEYCKSNDAETYITFEGFEREVHKKIVDAAGGFLIAKKPGTAKVSALVNGKRRTITVIVGKKPAPKPKLKQLQVKVKGYKYYPDSGKTIYTTRFTNKSKSTITKVKLKFTMTINEEMTRTKTFKVNIKPGKTKTMKLNIGKLIADPSNITVKCLKFWYKS